MKKLLLVLTVATLAFSGCSTTEHLTSNHNVTQTSIELSQKNYKVIGNVQGTATATRIFCFGGLSRKAIEANAQADMMKSANLSGSQAVVNSTTEVKRRGFPLFYWRTRITSNGQIIEFTE